MQVGTQSRLTPARVIRLASQCSETAFAHSEIRHRWPTKFRRRPKNLSAGLSAHFSAIGRPAAHSPDC